MPTCEIAVAHLFLFVLHCVTNQKKGKMVMTTLTVRVPAQLRDDLQTLSQQEHKAVSDIVRESLRRYVALQQFRALRRKVLPFAEAQGLVTDEDIFKALS